MRKNACQCYVTDANECTSWILKVTHFPCLSHVHFDKQCHTFLGAGESVIKWGKVLFSRDEESTWPTVFETKKIKIGKASENPGRQNIIRDARSRSILSCPSKLTRQGKRKSESRIFAFRHALSFSLPQFMEQIRKGCSSFDCHIAIKAHLPCCPLRSLLASSLPAKKKWNDSGDAGTRAEKLTFAWLLETFQADESFGIKERKVRRAKSAAKTKGQ